MTSLSNRYPQLFLSTAYVTFLGSSLTLGCAGAGPEDLPGEAAGNNGASTELPASTSASDVSDDAIADAPSLEPVELPFAGGADGVRCRPPDGMSGAPTTIEETVALINALPKPTSIACFIESLERPLYAHATSSITSAQPAHSKRSPRLFFLTEPLILSVVLEGESSFLLELSYLTSEDRSIKGELQFPVEEALAPSAPYDKVMWGSGTICRFCHRDEEQVPELDFAQVFESGALRPMDWYRVPISSLRDDYMACDIQTEPRRCDILQSIFAHGDVHYADFPDTMPTFL